MTPATLALGLNCIFTGLISLSAAAGMALRQFDADEIQPAMWIGGAAAFLFAISALAIFS